MLITIRVAKDPLVEIERGFPRLADEELPPIGRPYRRRVQLLPEAGLGCCESLLCRIGCKPDRVADGLPIGSLQAGEDHSGFDQAMRAVEHCRRILDGCRPRLGPGCFRWDETASQLGEFARFVRHRQSRPPL
ncbi:hypothetical protein [Kribbella deserti]|uniref:Uncharacterized protein n=1 Tax=Kribbella deserti TaxID=1926257 RepID=A0ABV6QYI4_9ACTN